MSSKFKYCLFVVAGMATSAIAGAYITGCSPSLPTSNRVTPTQEQSNQTNYKPIALETIGASLQGSDPKTVAQKAFGNIESEGGVREEKVEYPQANRAVVTITQTGLADDSTAAIQYRVELVPTAESAQTQEKWKIVWAGSQIKCWPDRGHQDWSTEKCL